MIALLLTPVAFTASGQDTSGDTLDGTGNYYFVVFHSEILSNDSLWTEPDLGDYYRVKFKNPDIQVNDALQVRFVEGTNVAPVSKDSLSKYGISELSDLSLVFLKSNRNCWLRTTDLETKMKGDTLHIVNMTVSPATVIYEKKQVCENDAEPIWPFFSEETESIEYTSPNGLAIDRYSGKIMPGDQEPGDYIVQYNSFYCLDNYEDTISILPKPAFAVERSRRICPGTEITLTPYATDNVSFSWSTGDNSRSITVTEPDKYSFIAENEYGCKQNDTINVELKTIEIKQLEYDVTDADCYTPGSLNLKKLEIKEGLLPYNYYFKNKINGQITTEPSMLREGDYILTIEDADGCLTSYQKIISIRKDCLTDRPVFSPNTDGRDDDYYIPYEGEAIIYDRNGMVRHRFEAPGYWDGKDGNGNPLPMGTYLIVVGKEIINITIIK
ncbi:MAG: hypothetical protein JXB00_07935 [Bacteroidales bacterium]|nr:hypothetical protein [Bacteroidales bacterium]